MYRTPVALESAVKDKARSSALNTSYAIELFVYDRFLCRIFSSDKNEFVLKGGQSILARVPDARVTRDVDLHAEESSLESAVARIIELASVDLGDFLEYRFEGLERLRISGKEREGARLLFAVNMGYRPHGKVAVDLVVGCNPTGELLVTPPLHRLFLKGLQSFDYRLYPIVDTLADKVCAITYGYSKRSPSSRVKDLVDILVMAHTQVVRLELLARALQSEFTFREGEAPTKFAVPELWHEKFRERYAVLAKDSFLPGEYQKLGAAEQLAKEFVGPAFFGKAANMVWSPKELRWK